MSDTEEARRYPLEWPSGWKRTPYNLRAASAFGKRVEGRTAVLEVGDGLKRLHGELRLLGAANITISSNLQLRQDGLPIAGQAKQLTDPGVAVYFRLKGRAMVLACDKWRSAADNLAAIAGHIEAIRAQGRYGVGSLEQAMAGYKALPADVASNWRNVLGFTLTEIVTPTMVAVAFKQRSQTTHPDRPGGSEDAQSIVNRARDYALMELNP